MELEKEVARLRVENTQLRAQMAVVFAAVGGLITESPRVADVLRKADLEGAMLSTTMTDEERHWMQHYLTVLLQRPS